MTILATDSFNRGNSGDLGASWDVMTSETAMAIVSNAAQASIASVDCSESNNTVTWPNDQYSEITYGTVGVGTATGIGHGPACRMATGARTYYRAIGSEDGYELGKFVAGSYTQLATGTGTIFANSNTYKLSLSSTTWTLYKNGTSFATNTDSAIASGRAGITYSSPSDTLGSIDSWEGGDLAAADVLRGQQCL